MQLGYSSIGHQLLGVSDLLYSFSDPLAQIKQLTNFVELQFLFCSGLI